MTAAMPTPTSEKTSVSCANRRSGCSRLCCRRTRRRRHAIAARTVVATEATTAKAIRAFIPVAARRRGRRAGVVRVGICVVVDMSSSVSSRGAGATAHAPPRTAGYGSDRSREEVSLRVDAGDAAPPRVGRESGRDAGAASPVGDALDDVAAEPAHERPVLLLQGAERAVGSEEPDRQAFCGRFRIGGCRSWWE